MAKDISHFLCNKDRAEDLTHNAAKSIINDIEFLDYEFVHNLYREGTLIQKISDLYNTPLDVVDNLASDPDHNGKHTVSSCIEAMVALEIERDGIL